MRYKSLVLLLTGKYPKSTMQKSMNFPLGEIVGNATLFLVSSLGIIVSGSPIILLLTSNLTRIKLYRFSSFGISVTYSLAQVQYTYFPSGYQHGKFSLFSEAIFGKLYIVFFSTLYITISEAKSNTSFIFLSYPVR